VTTLAPERLPRTSCVAPDFGATIEYWFDDSVPKLDGRFSVTGWSTRAALGSIDVGGPASSMCGSGRSRVLRGGTAGSSGGRMENAHRGTIRKTEAFRVGRDHVR
jgi:hypothetical protein